MQLSDFDYILPKDLIAQYPLKERDQARLMVLNRNDGSIRHAVFKGITDDLRKGDLLVLNDTKVIPCRLFGSRPSGGKAEVLLLKRKSGFSFDALIKPGRVRLQEKIDFNGGKIQAQVTGKNEVTFYAKDLEEIYAQGVMPLPPYIKRMPQEQDAVCYQTVYASKDGAIAAPTAGLHFTREALAQIGSQGVGIAYLTLHVGYSTFRPVKSEDIREHVMGFESFCIPDGTISRIDDARKTKGRIIAVGTTTLRALETYASSGAKEGETDLFIYPGYKFKLADCLLTNFHLPRTTLFMLVCAFCSAGTSASGGGGMELIRKAYREAIDREYRFYSYGDAMLIV